MTLKNNEEEHRNKENLCRNIDTAIYFGAGLTIVGASTALTLMSFGVSSPITLATTSFGLGLVGAFASTLIPINYTKYDNTEHLDTKPLTSPSKTIYEMFVKNEVEKSKVCK